MKMSAPDLVSWCCDKGFLQDRRGETCSKCGVGSLEVAASRSGESCSYVCDRRTCRYSESVCAREPGFFLPRVPLGKQMLVLYKMVYDWQPGVARLAQDLELDEHTVQGLVDGVRRFVSWVMRRANSILQVGGVDEDVEADEVCFRCKPFVRDGVKMRKWFRYLGVVRRGSALCYWGELDERETEASQGGGGPIGDAELEQHMLHRPGGRSLLAPWSVLHTDGAPGVYEVAEVRRRPHVQEAALVSHIRPPLAQEK